MPLGNAETLIVAPPVGAGVKPAPTTITIRPDKSEITTFSIVNAPLSIVNSSLTGLG